ncbi:MULTISPECIES: hypothetical protein [Pseudomonadaceae]|mgnify:CR=1 FL=1|jgi:hypothetical protein|uniref:hypothetical protein n=1 Tax=Pseudomonadaceae TaxID=135621 RepID=UPI0005667AC3|nr:MULTISPECIES: hypothetical protein [Pseudomonas]AYK23495.1 hypothetical protein PA34_015855 [Pseudomonas aeruginosa]OWJ93271.1 hypothetical protein B6S59_17755 [Pseudomonas sp. A46]KYO79617.1 hypothetical protein LL05_05495 [Pseudomonas aeruginosa]MCO7552381.1 hypothetical protein [Pseudomonas otitidis]MDR8016160.1 hypothetical protein [Pseudomonas guguanensis]
MFTTYRSAEIHLDTAKGTTAQLWSYVEQEISWPWFYLQIARRHGRQAYRSMLMLNHAHDLKKIIDDQSNLAWVEEVQLVTPAHVNGHSTWLMEPLKEICIVRDGPAGDPGYLYKVADGVSYSMHHRKNLEALIVTDVIFSAEMHLRRNDINA